MGVTDRMHPTQKPIELLTELIEACTDKDDLVVDPFAGVASTLVAASRLGRDFIGWEIEKQYHADGMGRLLGSRI
ncbi:MAG: Modification methylase MjaV [Candidatus Methanolliviera sp. GoM_asphalt]|nr:MAG: Modification methylase MjaV [Candidatus Methanolliviera sp. GoM_asphalt]